MLFTNCKITIPKCVFLFLFFGIFQKQAFTYSEQIARESAQIWSVIETQLEQDSADVSFDYMKLLVKGQCDQDVQCLFDTYAFIKYKLERRFDLPAAITICEAMLSLAQQEKHLQKQAFIHLEFSRYQSALGNEQSAVENLEKALSIHEELGNQEQADQIKMRLLERSLNYRNIEEVLPEINKLLKTARLRRDNGFLNYLNGRMIHISLSYQKYEAAERHISAIENAKVSNPLKREEYGMLIYAAIGRAELSLIKKDTNNAEIHFLRALKLCREAPDYWLEVKCLQSLARLEWEGGNGAQAKIYLAEAEKEANNRQMDDMITENYRIKTLIAEEEKVYKEAYESLKNKLHFQEKHESKSAGFDIQKFYLRKEKEVLANEKRQQELELKLSQVRQRNLLIIIALSVFLATALALGFYNQHRRKQQLAEQNLLIQSQSEKLKQLDATKSQFFANVSHELRTPLSLMLAPVDSLIKENHLSERQTELLKMATRSGKQLGHLINEILDLSKLEMGKMELDEKPTPLKNFFRRYFLQFESLAERKEIDFQFDIEIGDNLTAKIDQSKCRQMLFNLLSNAFKFTPNGGKVSAIVSTENQMLKLQIKDSGRGIHPEDIPHLFERYFQTSQPNKPAEGGTGIGLALCKEYADLFGGKLEVESELEKGSIFQLSFPLVLVESIEEEEHITDYQIVNSNIVAPAAVVNLKSKKSKHTVLIVEDNLELQRYLSLILEEKYNVLTAQNGQEALDCLLQTTNCKLIISDLMMPVMDGYQFLEKIKSTESLRPIPVIMLTARADAQDKLKALRIGVDDYLLKPFLEEELLVRIQNLLNNQTLRKLAVNNKNASPKSLPNINFKDQEWLKNFERYIEKNLSKDILTIPMLARDFAMSESSLLRQLKRLTGLSPNQYLKEMRLNQARTFLENRSFYSIQKVAQKVGYNDAKTFSRSFKKRFGKLPSEFMN